MNAVALRPRRGVSEAHREGTSLGADARGGGHAMQESARTATRLNRLDRAVGDGRHLVVWWNIADPQIFES